MSLSNRLKNLILSALGSPEAANELIDAVEAGGGGGGGDIKSDGSVPFSADQSMGSHKLINVTDPTSNQDAATKKYVDDNIPAGTSPGAPTTSVQYNDGGVFAGDASFYFNKTHDSLALGDSHTITGANSFAQGNTNVATGDWSTAVGLGSTASGSRAFCEGSGGVASQTSSHCEGTNCISSGTGSHAEGSSTTASGGNAHAEGRKSQATGNSSHAGGGDAGSTDDSSVASGQGSFAHGLGAVAQGYMQMALGLYNVAQGTGPVNNGTDDAFIIGNGTSDGARSNAFAITKQGLVRMDQGGQRVKARLDTGATVTVDAVTDYFIACSNAGAITINLPAGVNGMNYKFNATTASGGATIVPNGGNTLNASGSIANGSSQELIFVSGVWYNA